MARKRAGRPSVSPGERGKCSEKMARGEGRAVFWQQREMNHESDAEVQASRAPEKVCEAGWIRLSAHVCGCPQGRAHI